MFSKTLMRAAQSHSVFINVDFIEVVFVTSDSFDTRAEQVGMSCVIIFIVNDVTNRICVNKDIKHIPFA